MVLDLQLSSVLKYMTFKNPEKKVFSIPFPELAPKVKGESYISLLEDTFPVVLSSGKVQERAEHVANFILHSSPLSLFSISTFS